jgi:hypothetical protein
MAQYAKSIMTQRFMFQWSIFAFRALLSAAALMHIHFFMHAEFSSQILRSVIHEAAVCSIIPAM